MAILLVLLVVFLLIARPGMLGLWFSGFDPKTQPGLVLVVVVAFFAEFLVLRVRVGKRDFGVLSALKWFGLNALAAALWALPVAAVLYSGILDCVSLYRVVIGSVLFEVVLVSLTTGWLWSRLRGGRLARGVGIFAVVNLASIAVAILAGYAWHYLYDWLEMRGAVDLLYEKTRFLRD